MRFLLLLTLFTALIVSACGAAPAAPTATPLPPTAEPATALPDSPMEMTEEPMGDADMEMTEEAMPDDDMDASAMTRPAWHSIALTNARTGETFTLADFEGQTILVEPMATWCSNCRTQLGNVTRAAEQLEGQPVVFIALSVAENISNADLAIYADRQAFPFIFAVATPEMLTALTDNFGRSAITPPSTPHFIIEPHGDVSQLFTGSRSTGDLVSLLTGGA